MDTVTIRKSELKILRHIVRKGGLKNLTLTGDAEGKRSRENHILFKFA